MKQAPLQLIDYCVTFIQVRANLEFNSDKPVDLDAELIDLESDVQPADQSLPEDAGTLWKVALRIEQPLPQREKRNIPYTYTLEMQGFVAVHPDFKGDRLERAVQVNGPSMLFGCAREILRAATGRGPYAPILIPSTNFLSRLPKANPPEISVSPTEEPSHSSGDTDSADS